MHERRDLGRLLGRRDLGRLLGLLAMVVVLVACRPGGSPSASSASTGTLVLTLTAAPVCPVERNPPDPLCAARPVPDRVILLLEPDGREVARGTSDDHGMVTLALPPGAYIVRAEPSTGFPAAPADQQVRVETGQTSELMLTFDTGIR